MEPWRESDVQVSLFTAVIVKCILFLFSHFVGTAIRITYNDYAQELTHQGGTYIHSPVYRRKEAMMLIILSSIYPVLGMCSEEDNTRGCTTLPKRVKKEIGRHVPVYRQENDAGSHPVVDCLNGGCGFQVSGRTIESGDLSGHAAGVKPNAYRRTRLRKSDWGHLITYLILQREQKPSAAWSGRVPADHQHQVYQNPRRVPPGIHPVVQSGCCSLVSRYSFRRFPQIHFIGICPGHNH